MLTTSVTQSAASRRSRQRRRRRAAAVSEAACVLLLIDPAQTHTRPSIACGARSTTTHRVTGGIMENPEQRGSGPAHRAVPVRTASACPYAQSLTRGQVSGAAVLCSVLSRPQSSPVGYIMHGPSTKLPKVSGPGSGPGPGQGSAFTLERVKSIVNRIVNCNVNPVWGRFTLDFTIYSWPALPEHKGL